MAVVHREIPIQANAQAAWKKIADLGAVHEMMSFLTDATIEGDRRTCGLAMGGALSEIVLSVDSDLRRIAYSIVDSPFRLEFHAASMTVASDDSGTKLVWTSDFKPDAAAERVAGLIDAELENIAQFMSS